MISFEYKEVKGLPDMFTIGLFKIIWCFKNKSFGWILQDQVVCIIVSRWWEMAYLKLYVCVCCIFFSHFVSKAHLLKILNFLIFIAYYL